MPVPLPELAAAAPAPSKKRISIADSSAVRPISARLPAELAGVLPARLGPMFFSIITMSPVDVVTF